MRIAVSVAELARKNSAFEKAEPQEILAWAFHHFKKRWWWPFGRYQKGATIAWGLGYEGAALVHMAHELSPSVRIFTVDTLRLFPLALDLIPRVEQQYDVSVDRIYPMRANLARLERMHGPSPNFLDNDVHKHCCWVRKVEPFERAIQGYGAWITSAHRSQTGRSNLNILSVEPQRGGIVKICPFANWTDKEIWDYVIRNNVPYNPMHDDHWPSIGCKEPCTVQVVKGEDLRAGRWPGSENKECGIQI